MNYHSSPGLGDGGELRCGVQRGWQSIRFAQTFRRRPLPSLTGNSVNRLRVYDPTVTACLQSAAVCVYVDGNLGRWFLMRVNRV